MAYIKAYFNYKNDYQTKEIKLRDILRLRASSLDKWEMLFGELQAYENDGATGKNKNNYKYTRTQLCFKEIRLMLLYPRLDINVTKHINHLLKSPFCVHPKTGLISVPLTENDIVNFDISRIPNLTETIEDLREGR
jgi:DNA primase small subunit